MAELTNGTEGLELFPIETEHTPTHIQTGRDNDAICEVPGGYCEPPSETNEVFNTKGKDDVINKGSWAMEQCDLDYINPITSDTFLDNAPSRILANDGKIVGLLEEFCDEDNEGMIRDREFNRKIRTIKRQASLKSLRKTRLKRYASQVVDNTVSIPVIREIASPPSRDLTSPVVIQNESTDFEWKRSQSVDKNELDDIAQNESNVQRNISTDSLRGPGKNVRQKRETAMIRRDEIKREASKHGFWYTVRYIQFEKFKSKLNDLRSISLWSGEMKHVESIFGTPVVSYFIFLRFIFLLNVVLFLFMMFFVIVPQFIYNYGLVLNTTLAIRRNFTVENDLLGLITGDNWFEDTELFYGSYTNEIIAFTPNGRDPQDAIFKYNMPYVYLSIAFIILLIFLVGLTYKLGVAFRESYGTLGAQTSAEFCNRVFGAWDFGISNESAAKLRHFSITTDLKEEIDEFKAKTTKRAWKELLVVILLRIFFNIITFLLLLAAGVIIVFSTLWALSNRCPTAAEAVYLQPLGINIPGLVNSFTIVFLNFILQFIFPFFAIYERFRTQSDELKMTLVRSVLIRLASLIVLTLTLFVSYLFIQAGTDSTTGNQTVFSPDQITFFINSALNTNLSLASFQCQTFNCWETYFGQEFYRLAITNFVFAIIATIFPEITRFLFHRFGPRLWKRVTKFLKKPRIKKYLGILVRLATSPPEFVIAKSVLDIIYAQALMLLGFFFCPFLPFIAMVTFFVLFYVKKYSCVWFCSPSSRGLYRSARNNLLYIILLILIFFACVAAILFMLLNLNPSNGCGPFRTFTTFVGPIEIHLVSEPAKSIADLIKSPGLTYSTITLLLLLAYAQYVIVGSYKRNVKSLRHRLGVESADKLYYSDQLISIFNQAESLRKLHNDILKMHHHNQDMGIVFEYRDRLDSITNSFGTVGTGGARLSWGAANEREGLSTLRKQTANLDIIYERSPNRKVMDKPN